MGDRLAGIPPHPFAIAPHGTGGNGVNSGERFVYLIDGRRGRLDEALQDGDAYVTWDDGTYGEIKWNHIAPELTVDAIAAEQEAIRKAKHD